MKKSRKAPSPLMSETNEISIQKLKLFNKVSFYDLINTNKKHIQNKKKTSFNKNKNPKIIFFVLEILLYKT